MPSKNMLFIPAGAGEQVKVLGSIHTNKVTPDDTNGRFLALEISVSPHCGPPLHRHAADSEFFYVLEGEITFATPEGEVRARAGDFCYLPVGGYHGFRNDGDSPARALVMITPGMDAHHFFQELDRELDGAVEDPRVESIAVRNRTTFAAVETA
jgi:quercetin dioxygenase-like cupin family protein